MANDSNKQNNDISLSSDLNKLYENRFVNTETDDNLKKRNAIWRVLCNQFFSRFISEKDVVCDVAAGYCEFINNIKSAKKFAVDLNPSVKKYASSEIEVINDNVFNLKEHLKEKNVSAFFVSNFLEHLNNKEEVCNLIKELKGLLIPGGKIIILQPNIRLVGGAYWDFIDHKTQLTEKALIEVAEMNNLKVTTCITRFLPYTTKSALPKNALLVSMYLKLMPLSSFFLGKQSFLVFEKTK